MTPEIRDTKAILDEGSIHFNHSPKLWAECELPVELQWESVKFNRANSTLVPSNQIGVYAFMLEPDIAGPPKSAYLLYIGKTEAQRGFRSRYGSYLSQSERMSRPKIQQMLETWDGHIWFHYAPINNSSLIEQTEKALLQACVPPCNSKYPGKVGIAKRMWT